MIDSKNTFLNNDSGDLEKILKSIESNRIGPMSKALQIDLPNLPDITPLPIESHMEKANDYYERSLEILQSIANNTANLETLVSLINHSTETQDELLDLLRDILEIAKARNKEEARSLFMEVVYKINETAKSVESFANMVGWATTIYHFVSELFLKK